MKNKCLIAALLFVLIPAATVCAADEAKPAPAENTFAALEFVVEGNSKLSDLDIERAVYPFLGENKTVRDIEAARLALEKAYHDAGYLTVLVDIPPQRISDGQVALRVTEAPVDRLRITGSQYNSLGVIREQIPALAEGGVPDFNDVQSELAQLNRSPDRNVTPVMRAAKTPGKVDVDLAVKDDLPLHGSVEVNDHYSLNTSHSRAAVQLSYDNLWQQQHSIGLQYQTTPEKPDESKVLSLSYVIPGHSGRTWAMYAVASRSNVAAVGDLSVIGNGDIYGMRLIQSLPPMRGLNHSLSFGLDYKRFKDNVVQGADSLETPINYMPFQLQYSASLPQASGSSTSLDAGFNFIVRGLNADPAEFTNKRALADTAYTYFRGGLQREQMLPWNWQIFARVDTQFASGPLISNEQFAGGGAGSVRGYKEAEALGDDGWRGVFELHTPRLIDAQIAGIKTFYALAFVEGAHLRVRDALPGQQSLYTLASAGFGFRLQAWGFGLDLDSAQALKDVTPATGTGNTRNGDRRIVFRGSYGF